MNATVTYVHHNCFVLEFCSHVFLFDYPGEEHLVPGAREAMQAAIAGRDLIVCISHSHEDHFNPGIEEAVSGATRTRFVLSDDIAEMHPGRIPDGAFIVEPDERYEVLGLAIETLMSNDLGVAFLIEVDGRTVYYGGDLANWNWDSEPEVQREFTERFFAEALERIAGRSVAVAFSNCDGRLSSLAGAGEFVRVVRPGLFVPMHTFGNTEWLEIFRRQTGDVNADLFLYEKPGDSLEFTIS